MQIYFCDSLKLFNHVKGQHHFNIHLPFLAPSSSWPQQKGQRRWNQINDSAGHLFSRSEFYGVIWSRCAGQMLIPDSKVHGANMGPTWVLSAPDGLHVRIFPGPGIFKKDFQKEKFVCEGWYWLEVFMWFYQKGIYLHHTRKAGIGIFLIFISDLD